MPDLTHVLIELLVALLAGVLTSLVAVPLCKPLGLIDVPGAAPHKLHARPTPLAGGLVLGMSLALLACIYPNLLDGKMRGAVIAAAIILVFGIWDDRARLSPLVKFAGQFVAVGIAIWGGIQIEFLTDANLPGGPLAAQLINLGLTVFWLVGITNAFNLIDSMDGIVAGLSTLSSAFFIFVTNASGQPQLTLWASVLAGVSLALFFWNSPPARYFLGDSGAQTLGFLLAVLALLYSPTTMVQGSSWFAPILIVGVPIFDTSLVVFSRLRRHSPPLKGNRDHTYHRLVRGGLNPSRAVSLIHIVALALDSLALLAISQPPLIANAILILCLLTGISLIAIFDFSEKFISQPTHQSENR